MGHPAVFPVELPTFFIKLLSHESALIIDPFGGSGSTGIAAMRNGRNCVLIDNNPGYCQTALKRLNKEVVDLYNEVVFFNPKEQLQNMINEFYEIYSRNKKSKSMDVDEREE